MRSKLLSYILPFFLLIPALQGSPKKHSSAPKMTSINIVDRNGLSQTIHAKDRLSEYEKMNFLEPQPYQKVMRVYGKGQNGVMRAEITSYHPNGQVKQYLESVGGRAYGNYYEWFANGGLKVHAFVIGGVADLNSAAEDSWLFDGVSKAWDEEGRNLAQIQYSKGELEGISYYFHPNGTLWKQLPYSKNKLEGVVSVYLEDGTIFQTMEYREGIKEGASLRYWDADHIAYSETYERGLLMKAHYYDRQGNLLAEISEGNGQRAIFTKEGLAELQTYQRGRQEGLVKVFDSKGALARSYSIKEGEKEGEEIDYYPGGITPKLLLTWHQGVLQGVTKTWYSEGQLENQREMSQNMKNGLLTAWYKNGALMMVEEYDQDMLIKGEYYRMGEKIPVSKIEKGKGLATLFSGDGSFFKKIYYQDGKPLD